MNPAATTDHGPLPEPSDPAEKRQEEDERAQLEARVGLVVGGRYKILRILGAGGMGGVYEAVHELIGRKVAIKCLHAEYTRDREVVERFRREARAATAIGNEHIIDVTDVGDLPDGAPYLVMELLQGKTLGGLMSEVGAMKIPRVVHIARQVASALADAHRLGIVHRDLKPENVFLMRRGDDPDFVKVLDFGISKAPTSESNGPELTRTGMAIGTPSYMSPEQAQGLRDVDARTDVWAMGVMLYEMLANRRPFVAPTYPMLLMAIVGSEPKRLAQVRSDVPEGLDALVMRCLDKSPATRVASMRELEAGLAPFAGVDSVPRLVADGAPSTVSGSNDASEIRAVSRGERTSLAPRIAAALALIGALGLGAAWAYGGSTSAPSDETRVAPPPTIATTPAPSVVPVTTVVAIEAPPTSVAPIAMHRRIESDPTGATVLRNGEVVGTTPLDLALPDGAPIEITLRAPGRRTTTRTIGPDDPPVVSVHLDLARRAPSLPVLAPH